MGPAGFHFRVRNGNGWSTCGNATLPRGGILMVPERGGSAGCLIRTILQGSERVRSRADACMPQHMLALLGYHQAFTDGIRAKRERARLGAVSRTLPAGTEVTLLGYHQHLESRIYNHRRRFLLEFLGMNLLLTRYELILIRNSH